MKNYEISIQKILLLLFFLSISKAAFPHSGNQDSQIKGKFSEGLIISTDRDIYIAGEEVWIKIYKFDRVKGAPSDLSKILYAELLNDANNPVVQLKMSADSTSASGGFILPDTLTSGNYLIRAYTKWMLNFPEKEFAYRTISVLNPFKKIDRLINPAQKSAKEILTGSPDIRASEVNSGIEGNDNLIKVGMTLNKTDYSCREKIGLDISLSDASGKPIDADVSISVIKSSLSDPGRDQSLTVSQKKLLTDYPLGDSIWLPEPEGEIISGSIRNKQTNEPLMNSDISLSVVGKSALSQFGRTNTRGEFMFVVNRLTGPKEIVIQPFLHDESGCYVELNQPFCGTFAGITPAKFYLDSARAVEINSAVISMQVNNLYKPFRQKNKSEKTNSEIKDFYGHPSRRVLLSDFIELNDIREVVKEIIPEVRVYKKYDKSWFKISYDNPFQRLENQALVLVDGVPVNEIEGLLDMPSKDVERIDIISARYFYADFVFDGIMSFFTRKGNLNNLKFDDSVFRQIYEGCQEPEKFYSPVYNIDTLKTSRIPDFRNTLYWAPSVETGKNGKSSVEFYASDEPGEYNAIIEGMTSTGRPIFCIRKFRIK